MREHVTLCYYSILYVQYADKINQRGTVGKLCYTHWEYKLEKYMKENYTTYNTLLKHTREIYGGKLCCTHW